MLTSTLNDDGEPDGGVYDPLWEEKATRTQVGFRKYIHSKKVHFCDWYELKKPFDYIMHGLVYRVEGDEQEQATRL